MRECFVLGRSPRRDGHRRNERGEPIILSPDDAYRCFMRTEMDALVCWPFFIEKSKQPEWSEAGNWRDEFQLD
jgi:carbamoyltransferase